MPITLKLPTPFVTLRACRRWLTLLLLSALLCGCAVNPLTGQRELSLFDEQWERTVGATHYAPLRQAEGGDFTLNPELVRYVQSVGSRLVEHADRDLDYEFAVINSSVPNAWALPGGKIAINRGLLTELRSEAELAAVLGHEMAHAAARHGARAQSRQILAQTAVVLGGVAVGVATDRDEYATVAVLGGLLGAALIGQRHSRDAEREADYFGMITMHRAGYDPVGAVELQQSFVRLSEGRDRGFLDGMFASHPPSQERVENNRRTASELGVGGFRGEAEYQQQIALLQSLAPAYAALDAGRRAMAEGEVSAALEQAETALALTDQEPLFHNLAGDALASAGQLEAAEAAYSRALRLDQSWFYPLLRRGMVRRSLGRLEAARTDLQASITRLETADGHYHLGSIERALGRREAAISHYRIAAQSDDPSGQRARQALRELDAD